MNPVNLWKLLIPVGVGVAVSVYLIATNFNLEALHSVHFTKKLVLGLVLGLFTVISRDAAFMYKLRLSTGNKMTWLKTFRSACSRPARATEMGSATPGSGANTGTEIASPTICNCCTALGRAKSHATRRGVWPCSFSQSASFPANVVLPVPCNPARRIFVGGFLEVTNSLALVPRTFTISS